MCFIFFLFGSKCCTLHLELFGSIEDGLLGFTRAGFLIRNLQWQESPPFVLLRCSLPCLARRFSSSRSFDPQLASTASCSVHAKHSIWSHCTHSSSKLWNCFRDGHNEGVDPYAFQYWLIFPWKFYQVGLSTKTGALRKPKASLVTWALETGICAVFQTKSGSDLFSFTVCYVFLDFYKWYV